MKRSVDYKTKEKLIKSFKAFDGKVSKSTLLQVNCDALPSENL